eukprot:gene2685-2934_t
MSVQLLFSSWAYRFSLSASKYARTSRLLMSTDVKKDRNLVNQVSSASIASAAAVAAAAVNAAVSMRPLSAPDGSKTFVFKDGAAANRTGKVDEVGLPLIYDKELIEAYWKKQGSALSRRWTEFLGYSVPYLTKVITMVVSGGSEELKANSGVLAKDARLIFEKLGPTYIKMGQMMSVRPDVLPAEAMQELKALQDSVQPFDTPTAVGMIEKELGAPLGRFFSEISVEPVAAASLAQVYKAKLVSNGEWVAVKVQRPGVLEVVSKDLYVLRRAAEVYQGLMERFAPQQRTNYVALLNEWAVGFYTELDFLNEAANQIRLKGLLIKENVTGVYVPEVYKDLCTRRLLVSEWVDGVKLSDCPSNVIADLIPDAQEAFLTQLLQIGFFHADPHPGNLLYLPNPRGKARIALLDFGLVASVTQQDMDTMVSALIHLANKDYTSLVDDFIALDVLPMDCDRSKVVPLMDKALTPYVKGGGAKEYEKELRRIYGLDQPGGMRGGFQAMTQDAITVFNDIPFSIPPYFALLGRAIVTLEGVALSGNPQYGIVMESYPFVARKLLREDRPAIQRALQQVLYNKDGLQANRLSVLLNSALGVVAHSSDAFVDFDSLPEDGVSLKDSIKFLLSPSASSLRNILVKEAVLAIDILARQATRKAFSVWMDRLPRPPFFLKNLFPRPQDVALPFLVPVEGAFPSDSNKLDKLRLDQFTPILATPSEMVEAGAPKLSREEELYALSLSDLARQTLGENIANIVSGTVLVDQLAAGRALVAFSVLLDDQGVRDWLKESQLATLYERVLKPLQRVISFTSAGAVRGKSSLGKADEKHNDDVGKEMLEAVEGLSSVEQTILRETVEAVLWGAAQRLLERLHPLANRPSAWEQALAEAQ